MGASDSPDPLGPYLVLAAFWLDDGDTKAVVAALRSFPVPEGRSHGAVVAFRREVAERSDFARDLARFDLAELHE